jgi:N-acylneuraminate cytidylyltransferase
VASIHSGSTRIKDKNIREICGIPLLAYTIAVAKALPVDRVIVNTDSRQYASIAEKYGAEAPFIRPEELSRDDTPPGMAGYFADRYLLAKEKYPLGIVIDMYPTSLFRNVARCAQLLEKVRKSGFCATAFLPAFSLADIYLEQGRFVPDCDHINDTGKIHFKAVPNFIGRNIDPWKKSWFNYALINNPIELIDIDTDQDVAIAEAIIENGLYDFGVTI